MPGQTRTERIEGLSGDIAKLETQLEELLKGDGEEESGERVRVSKKKKAAAADDGDGSDAEDAADGGADDWSEEADAKKQGKMKKAIADGTALELDGKFISKEMVGEAAFEILKAKKKADKEAEDKAKADAMNKNADVIEVDGQKIAKSAVGEAAFTILKAQADKIAKNDEEIKKERTLRETAQFEKRADDEFAHIPGTTAERGELLKAVDALPEIAKKAALSVLTAHEKMAKAAFGTVGHKGGGGLENGDSIAKASRDFTTKVSEIAKRDSLSKNEAMSKARQEHPDLFKAYQESGN